MKKTLVILVAVLALVLSLSAASVLAADTLKVSFGEPVYNEDGTISIALEISDNPGIYYLDLKLDYDADAFSAITIENKTTLGLAQGSDKLMGKFMVYCNGIDNYTENGTLVIITLTPAENAPHADFEIGIVDSWTECYNVDEDDVAVDTGKTTVTIAHDVAYVEAIAPGCHYIGNTEYWYCTGCDIVWADEALTQVTNRKNVIIPELGGDVVHVEAKDATCMEQGNIEYWYCEECEQVWQDEARTQLTNFKNVIIGLADHTLVHMDAVEAGCHYEGLQEHWYCTVCDTVWTDEALTQISNHKSVIIPAIGGDVVHVEAKDATCMEEGNIEYWYCEECEQVWQDEALTQLTNFKNVIIGVADHTIVHMDAVEAGCHYEGLQEHWYCTVCDTVWTDEALTQISNHKNVIIPATGEGNLVHMDAVAAGCHSDGNIEYWICYECEQVWQDEALTQLTNIKNVIIPATGEGNLVHMDAVAPGCHYEGNIEYWVCYDCELVWQDEALTQLTNIKSVMLPALGGEVIHVEAKAPTATENGNIEYWYCEECEQVWQDEDLIQLTNIKNVIIPATGALFGDIDGDGKANAKDYLMLKSYVLGSIELTDEQVACAEISGDGKVNARDYLMLKSYILGTWTPDAQ